MLLFRRYKVKEEKNLAKKSKEMETNVYKKHLNCDTKQRKLQIKDSI